VITLAAENAGHKAAGQRMHRWRQLGSCTLEAIRRCTGTGPGGLLLTGDLAARATACGLRAGVAASRRSNTSAYGQAGAVSKVRSTVQLLAQVLSLTVDLPLGWKVKWPAKASARPQPVMIEQYPRQSAGSCSVARSASAASWSRARVSSASRASTSPRRRAIRPVT